MERSVIWKTQNLAFEQKKYILRRGSYSVHLVLFYHSCGIAMLHLCQVSQCLFTSRAQALFAAFFLVLSAQAVMAQGTGAAWRYLGPNGGNIIHIASANDTLYAAAASGAFFRSTDGTSWTQMNALSAPRGAMGLAASSGQVVVTYAAPIFPGDDVVGTWFIFSTNGGISSFRNFSFRQTILGMAASNGFTVLATNVGILERVAVPQVSNRGVLLTTATLTCIAMRESNIYAGSRDSQIFRSTNKGVSWIGIAAPFIPRAIALVDSQILFAASTSAIFCSSDGGLFWKQMGAAPINTSIQGLTTAFGCLYAATNVGVYRSSDSGKTWQGVNEGLLTQRISDIVAHDSATFALVGGMWFRAENTRLSSFTFPNGRIVNLRATPAFLFAFTDSTIWRSRNGHDWQQIGIRPNNVSFGKITATENERVHYVATTDGIYRSIDSGRSWRPAWLQSRAVYEFGIVTDTIYASSILMQYPSILPAVLLRSTDGGNTWQEQNLKGSSVSSSVDNIVSFRQGLYCAITSDFYTSFTLATDLFRLYGFQSIGAWQILTRDMAQVITRRNEILRISPRGFVEGSSDGQRWNSYTTNGLNNITVNSFAANNQAIFVGTSGGLYVLDAPTTTVAVREPAPLTTEWRIHHQPTNNALLLTVQLPSAAHVRCTLHTALGQEIATLADNAYAAGAHEITTTLQGMASGLYLCRLAVGGRVVGSKSVVVVL